ncbi:MAG: hypothetical protein LBL84_01880 [Candidatus Nomurabacteria bacterium]|jgi:hypothetical protein|nr:hypothetical protein [Candidatus Nomurabacteria bacterium]
MERSTNWSDAFCIALATIALFVVSFLGFWPQEDAVALDRSIKQWEDHPGIAYYDVPVVEDELEVTEVAYQVGDRVNLAQYAHYFESPLEAGSGDYGIVSNDNRYVISSDAVTITDVYYGDDFIIYHVVNGDTPLGWVTESGLKPEPKPQNPADSPVPTNEPKAEPPKYKEFVDKLPEPAPTPKPTRP